VVSFLHEPPGIVCLLFGYVAGLSLCRGIFGGELTLLILELKGAKNPHPPTMYFLFEVFYWDFVVFDVKIKDGGEDG